MIVPPYVPDAIQVSENVAEERYAVRVAFIRRVVLFHGLSWLAVWALAISPMPSLPVVPSALALVGSLVALSVMRDLTKPRPIDQLYSLAFSPVMFVFLAMTLRGLLQLEVPVWALGLGLVASVLYTFLCGRDFSFVGQYVLALGASSVAIVLLSEARLPGSDRVATALLINGVCLSYFVYDLAALQTRRRRKEVLAAVIDLYRDVLNIFSYAIRVVRHWKRHKIWAEELGLRR
ncbi:MAG TPA: hypothetical protein VM328_10560 [Fimbriimonadaceae bacterium]|nr:hypothetical protein [Fimbriimonadaceae bacterium]